LAASSSYGHALQQQRDKQGMAVSAHDRARRGHQIQERSGWGNANAIVLTADGWLEGAADRRGEGAARGF